MDESGDRLSSRRGVQGRPPKAEGKERESTSYFLGWPVFVEIDVAPHTVQKRSSWKRENSFCYQRRELGTALINGRYRGKKEEIIGLRGLRLIFIWLYKTSGALRNVQGLDRTVSLKNCISLKGPGCLYVSEKQRKRISWAKEPSPRKKGHKESTQ